MIQRILDIFLSGFAIVALFPVLLPVVFLLRFSGEGEIFFSQKRVGKSGDLFKLLKFATMMKDSPNIGAGTVTLKDDPRVLPLGKILRKTKINELPQLINILRGDMSIVGPRPQTPRCFDVFPADCQKEIIKVRPGLSGLGSIVFRDEENILSENEASIDYYDTVIAPYKGEIESFYVNSENIATYFKVILATIWVVVLPNSKIVWRLFPKLPPPPNALANLRNYD